MRFSLFKGMLLLLLFASLALAGCSEQQDEQPRATSGVGKGQQAPDFTLSDMQGKKVSLADFRGKVVLINFWASWCPPCRKEMPSMERLYRQYQQQGLVILAVNVEKNGAQAVQRFLQQTPYSFPILLDTDAEVQNRYKVFRFPESFIIDRNGKVVEKVIGAIDWTSGSTFELIKFLLDG